MRYLPDIYFVIRYFMFLKNQNILNDEAFAQKTWPTFAQKCCASRIRKYLLL